MSERGGLPDLQLEMPSSRMRLQKEMIPQATYDKIKDQIAVKQK